MHNTDAHKFAWVAIWTGCPTQSIPVRTTRTEIGNTFATCAESSQFAPTQLETDAEFSIGSRPPAFESASQVSTPRRLRLVGGGQVSASSNLGSRPFEFMSQSEVGSSVLDALQRDLEGPEMFPMTDDAEVEEAPVPIRRQSRRLVLVPQRT